MPMDMRYIAWAGYDLAECYTTTGSGIGSGSIQLEYGWQLIAIPIEYGYWDDITHAHVHDDITVAKFKNYVLDQIDDLYPTASGVYEIVEIANTYPGDDQRFWTFVPHPTLQTPESDPNNFQMVYADGVNKEISGFWIKIIGSAAPYLITWGEQ